MMFHRCESTSKRFSEDIEVRLLGRIELDAGGKAVRGHCHLNQLICNLTLLDATVQQ